MLEQALHEQSEKNGELIKKLEAAEEELLDTKTSKMLDLEAEVRDLTTKLEISENTIAKRKEEREFQDKGHRKDHIRFEEDIYNLRQRI